jgi:hypothetical protein
MVKNGFDGNLDAVNQSLQRMVDTTGASGWNAPVWIGEFGTPAAFSPSSPQLPLDLANGMYHAMDQQMLSGAQWVYTPGFDSTLLDGWNRENLSINADAQGHLRSVHRRRPYPQRIAGTPIDFGEQQRGPATTDRLIVKWENDPQAGSTEIFAPKDVFAAGDVRIQTSSDDLTCAYDTAKTWLVKCDSATPGEKIVWIISADAH